MSLLISCNGVLSLKTRGEVVGLLTKVFILTACFYGN